MISIKIIFKKILGLIFYIFIFLFVVFAVCEIWFRVGRKTPFEKYAEEIIKPRLWFSWLNKDNTDPLLPPYRVFAPTDFDNFERLRFIVKETSLPRNTTLKSYDFLRSEKIREKTSYIATINNLGFRDPPRTIQKPENVFRIIALGSYHTFGHAVNDEDTYPRQLERILNSLKTGNITFEVWNGGRHTGSVIVGLARLKTEILEYQPDLIIWDYGFIDSLILGDDNFPKVFFFPDSGIYRPLAWFQQLTKNIIAGKSMVFVRFGDYLIRKNLKKNMEASAEVNKRMLEFTKEHNIPVVLLRNNVTINFSPAFYQALLGSFEHVYFVDGEKIFKKYPPSLELIKEFYSGENWLSEFDPAFRKGWKNRPEYFIDIFQYNKWGHRVIATYLADVIIDFVKKHYPKT